MYNFVGINKKSILKFEQYYKILNFDFVFDINRILKVSSIKSQTRIQATDAIDLRLL